MLLARHARRQGTGRAQAFGAERQHILRLIADQGMRPVLAGLGVGLAGALALGRLIASQLYQTSAHSPVLLAATLAILGLAALAACVIPARRATSIDPMNALRAP
jgi:ABC-type lipoprotein release transport system permease subunit